MEGKQGGSCVLSPGRLYWRRKVGIVEGKGWWRAADKLGDDMEVEKDI